MATIFLLAASSIAATPGEFRGKIINPPRSEADSACIYIVGRNHVVRRVVIQESEVIYASSVPLQERNSNPNLSLTEGAEVRVSAVQNKDGDWQAMRIEILHTPDKPASQAIDNLSVAR